MTKSKKLTVSSKPQVIPGRGGAAVEPVSHHSELDAIQADITSAIDYSAAEFVQSLQSLLERAFWLRSDMSQQRLAEVLGVSAGRVSQVLSGQENLRASTVARYARALGYEIAVQFESVDQLAKQMRVETRAPANMNDVFIQLISDGLVIEPQFTLRSADIGPNVRPVSPEKYLGKIDVSQSSRKFELTSATPGTSASHG